EGLDGRLVHADDLGAVEQLDAFAIRPGGLGQGRFNLRLIADEDDTQDRVGLYRLNGPGDDWARRVVPTHRVQRDEHGSLLLLLHRDDLALLDVRPAAVGAQEVVAGDRVAAVVAVTQLARMDVVMTAALALPGVRNSSLRDCHGSGPLSGTRVGEKCMLGKPLRSVKQGSSRAFPPLLLRFLQ